MDKINWQFDEKFLNKAIKDATKLLKNNNISSNTRDNLECSLREFSLFLDVIHNNYKSDEDSLNEEEDFNSMAHQFKCKAEYDYNTFGEELVDLIIELYNGHEPVDFKTKDYNKEQEISLIVGNSLDLYKEFAPNFYSIAQTITDYPINLINFSDKHTIGSSCYYDELFELPFIHVETSDLNPNSFIHELQHGVERTMKYNTWGGFYELGPILMETLFIDKMVKLREPGASSLYFDRINGTEQIIEDLGRYFMTLKILKSNNFDMTNLKLSKLLYRNGLICNDDLEMQDLITNNYDLYFVYLISFLKSLEIRKKMYQDKKYGLKLLKKELSGKTEANLDETLMLRNYNSFLNEVDSKEKNYPHGKRYIK